MLAYKYAMHPSLKMHHKSGELGSWRKGFLIVDAFNLSIALSDNVVTQFWTPRAGDGVCLF